MFDFAGRDFGYAGIGGALAGRLAAGVGAKSTQSKWTKEGLLKSYVEVRTAGAEARPASGINGMCPSQDVL
jgi:hypothetical protein